MGKNNKAMASMSVQFCTAGREGNGRAYLSDARAGEEPDEELAKVGAARREERWEREAAARGEGGRRSGRRGSCLASL